MVKKPLTITYDIETSYAVSATWGIFDQNVAKVLREPYIISVAWKVLGEKKGHVIALPDFPTYKKDRHNDYELVKYIRDNIFDPSDILIAHNGKGFDQKWVTGRMVIHDMEPPKPSQVIDTLLIARNKFHFLSNKLKDLGRYFKLGDKLETGGIDLWVNCIEYGLEKAWRLMKRYNLQDVILLEKVYLRMLPFITNHPNVAVMIGETRACPNCGSTNIQKRGVEYSRSTVFQSWYCWDCKTRPRSALKENSQVR